MWVSLYWNQDVGRDVCLLEAPRDSLFLAFFSFWRLSTFFMWWGPSIFRASNGHLSLTLYHSDTDSPASAFHIYELLWLPPEKPMAPHSSTLAWKIPWMEEPGRLQSMGSPRVGHDWAISLSLFTFMHWRRKWQPTPVFLPGESQGRGSLVDCIYGVAQSRTRLKRLSSSSSSDYLEATQITHNILPVLNMLLYFSLAL